MLSGRCIRTFSQKEETGGRYRKVEVLMVRRARDVAGEFGGGGGGGQECNADYKCVAIKFESVKTCKQSRAGAWSAQAGTKVIAKVGLALVDDGLRITVVTGKAGSDALCTTDRLQLLYLSIYTIVLDGALKSLHFLVLQYS
nr:hypothetical protein L203_05157 [Cryptococcus depauperatus CBS 7841]